MSDKMLSPFRIRNLRSLNEAPTEQDSLVRISAPGYDKTITNYPAATLRYEDEENDTIILGSSRELIDKLKEPVQQPCKSPTRKSKDRMSIAMLLAQYNPEESLKHHVFTIDEREEIQKLWRQIQQGSTTRKSRYLPTEVPFKWSNADEAQLAQYCDEGMDFGEIMSRMGHRSAQSCQWYYQNYLDNKKMKSEAAKNKVAAAYERTLNCGSFGRLRKTIWVPIAAEAGISSEEAESMHWAMGKYEMSLRAQEAFSMDEDTPVDIMSVKSTDGDWHENRQPKVSISPHPLFVPSLDDFRKHHFDATMPPRLQSRKPKINATKTWSPRLKSTMSFPSKDAAPAANLTVEGRRQAQAAGEILRARTMTSRHRKAMMSATDHTSHQNRWAGYKPSDTAFSIKTSTDVPQGFQKSTLTFEGKRQAQAAGDKLRCRTNPIRHSRPSRSGSLENGVNKNRWSSYAPRVARFEDRHHDASESIANSEPKDTEPKKADKPPSLLEVFETELAKGPSFVNDALEEKTFPDPDISDIPPSTEQSTASAKDMGETLTFVHNAPSSPQPNALLNGVKMISDHLQGLAGVDVEAPQELSQVLENGLRTAAGGFEGLLRGLTGGLQEISDRSQQAAARTRELDTQGIDNTIEDLQNFVVSFTTGLGAPEVNERTNEKTALATDDSLTPASQPIDSSVCESLLDKPRRSPNRSSIGPLQQPQQHAIGVDTDAEAKSAALVNRCESYPETPSKVAPRQKMQPKHTSSSDEEDTTSAPRYHKPGPIHLPQRATLLRPASSVATHAPDVGPGYVNHLRQSQSTQYLNESVESRTTSPPPAATRFPTLAQFEEGQNFTPSPSFPPLPSMEPLIPQRADHPSMGAIASAQPHLVSPYAGSSVSPNAPLRDYQMELMLVEQQHKRQRADQQPTGMITTPQPCPVSHNASPWKLSGHALQDYQMQLMLLEQQNNKQRANHQPTGMIIAPQPCPASHNASSSKSSEHALQDYQLQLKLLEQQNKKRLLMARQEEDTIAHTSRPTIDSSSQCEQNDQSNNVTPATLAVPAGKAPEGSNQGHAQEVCDSSAARLAEPFDPLEVEPSAQPHMTEGVRRNATVAGTNSRHNIPRRRPYSEAYDGVGRLGWESFLGSTHHEGHTSPRKTTANLVRRQEHARKARENDRFHRKQEQLRRSATLNNTTNRSTPMFRQYDDERQDDSTVGATLYKNTARSTPAFRRCDDEHQDDAIVGAINSCVDQLRDLGFGNGDGSSDRLLIYAQAARGDLVEAIDMIDEEQRVYREMS